MTDRILFYRVGDAYGGFSNFSSADDREAIRREPSPMRAARMGRDRKRPLRPDWETVKDSVMLTALRAKFRQQHPALRDLLLGTGDAELIEHTAKDRYWADGGDGSGATCSACC